MFPRSAPLAVPLVVLAAVGIVSCSSLRFGHDRKVGARDAAYVARTKQTYPAGLAASYVNAVGERLEAALDHPELDFRFTLLDGEDLNAFALPGGYVYVTRSLLAATSTEDELAGTLAHEMMHSVKRHRAKKERRAILPNTLKIPGNVAGAILGDGVGDVVNTPVDFVSGATLARYSRRIEKEADMEAVKLMARAGYDPNSLAIILTKFDTIDTIDTAVTGKAIHYDYLSTHPYNPKRAEEIRQAARRLTIAPADLPDHHLAAIDGLLVGRDPRRRVINGRQALSEEFGLSLQFPEGWNVVPLHAGIASTSPDGDGFIYISPSPDRGHPDEIGPRFAAIAEEEFGGRIIRSEAVRQNGTDAYVVSLRDESGSANAYLHLVWIRNKMGTAQIVGMGTEAQQAPLRSTGRSIRAFRSADRARMTKLVIASTRSRKGESLGAFATRTGNRWSTEVTAAMNGLPPDAPLDGRMLKIARRTMAY